jgi:hypothetical protein
LRPNIINRCRNSSCILPDGLKSLVYQFEEE